MIRVAVIMTVYTLCLQGVVFGVDGSQNEYLDRLERTKKGVVCIEGNKIGESGYSNSRDVGKMFTGMGTGIIIDPRGYIITNQHVVDGLQKIMVTTSNGNKYTAVYLDKDADTDIALIKIDPKEELLPILVGDSTKLRWGERVSAIGNPLGFEFSVTDGVVSYIGRPQVSSEKMSYQNVIQTSAGINPGNSGGPLLNQNGEVVAINVAVHSGAQGIAFAVPIDAVMETGAKLVNKQNSQFCYHGIRVQKYNDPLSGGVVVESVDPGSPAEAAGIIPKDVIYNADRNIVEKEIDFQRAFLEKRANQTVEISIERNSENIMASVTLAAPGGQNIRSAARPIQQRSATVQMSKTSPGGRVSVADDKSPEELIWDVFGIQIRPVPASSLEMRDPNLSNTYPHGAVMITAIKKDSVLLKHGGIKENDLLVGIEVGESEDRSWSIASVGNLKYVAERWNAKLLGSDRAIVHVIRDKEVSFQWIPVSENAVIAAPQQRGSVR